MVESQKKLDTQQEAETYHLKKPFEEAIWNLQKEHCKKIRS